MVHARGAGAEHRYINFFAERDMKVDEPVMRRCRDSYNAVNDPAFELTNDPVTCKTCKNMGVEVIVEFA
jgi:hypothetical protein